MMKDQAKEDIKPHVDPEIKKNILALGMRMAEGGMLSKPPGMLAPAEAEFPPWMEGRWAVTSRPLSIAAPLGRRFLPADLARVRLGDLSQLSVPPLQYEVSFIRRDTDGAIVSDRCNNLRAVQDAAAGFARVETASFDEKASKISVTCAPPVELSRAATCLSTTM